MADTFHMPIYVAMALPQEPEPPASATDRRTPEVEPLEPDSTPGTGSHEPDLTAEQLARVVNRLETGFYDRAEIREQIARRVREDLGP